MSVFQSCRLVLGDGSVQAVVKLTGRDGTLTLGVDRQDQIIDLSYILSGRRRGKDERCP